MHSAIVLGACAAPQSAARAQMAPTQSHADAEATFDVAVLTLVVDARSAGVDKKEPFAANKLANDLNAAWSAAVRQQLPERKVVDGTGATGFFLYVQVAGVWETATPL